MKRYGWLLGFLLTATAMILISIEVMHRGADPVVNQIDNEPQKEIELVFMNSWGGLDGRAQVLQDLLDKFMEENPGIKIQNASVYGDDFLPSIKTRFALGDDPDVFGLWPGSDIRSLIAAGKVADLTSLLDTTPDSKGPNNLASSNSGGAVYGSPAIFDRSFKNSFNKDMWQYVTVNDRIYGLPVEIIFETLYVNTDILDMYGLEAPTTYNELVKLVEILSGKGIIPIAYNSEPEGSYLYQNLIVMLGQKNDVENPVRGRQVNDCYIKAMYLMRDLYRLGAFPEDYYTLTSSERNNLFTQKKAAMIVQGSWFIPDVISDPAVDIIPFPKYDERSNANSDVVYGMGCGIFYVSSKAMRDPEKTEAVQKLLRYLASKQTAATLAERTGMVSNVDISEYYISYNRLTQKGLELVKSARSLVGPPDSFIDRTAWEDIIIKQFPYMLQGKISPEELWESALNRNSSK